jgi:NADH dehydrogenase [ubiquinone] 1 alpha subcomplex assembly factor 1
MNLLTAILIFMSQTLVLHDFSNDSKNQWQIVDDVVMGGRSLGEFTINKDGHGVFFGSVSTANNGGFSSLRSSIKTEDLSEKKGFVLKVKGDGKSYQFRVKTSLNERHSYIYSFQTNGKWQEIKIPFNKMFASWRGRTLDMPNYDGSAIEEIRFLIGNKKNEAFELEIESISVH